LAIASRTLRLLTAGASVVLALGLLALVELVAGFFVEPVRPRQDLGDAVSVTLSQLEVNPVPLARDVDLLWRNEPGARKTQPVIPQAFGRSDQWTLENNSEGFRGPEREAAAPGGKALRILCVGDSITYGYNVDQPDPFPQRLSELLAGRYPDRRFEVVNAGVPGWSWLQGLRFLEVRGLALQPDLVVIGHGTNDQLPPARVTDEERFLRLSGPLDRARHHLAALAAETNTYRAFSRLRSGPAQDGYSRGCREQILRWGFCHRVSLDQIATTVHEVSTLAAAHGAGLLVVNTDFVQTAAVEATKRGVEQDALAFVDAVAEINRRRKDDEEERAARLGLAASSVRPSTEGEAASGMKRMLLRVLVPDPTKTYRVAGTALYRPEFSFDAPVRDDGAMGDERAGDRVFSATIDVPGEFPAIEYQFHQGDKAEFAAPPPYGSVLGNRMLRSPGNLVAPIDVFGQSLFMVERAHPDRAGHRLMAELIADKLEEMPAFRDHVRGARR